MRNFIKSILIAFGMLLFTGCGERAAVKKLVDLSSEEKQDVIIMSGQFNALLRQKATLNFIKTGMQQANRASFMMNYLPSSFNSEQRAMANDIIGLLFKNKMGESIRGKTESDLFTLSPSVNEFTRGLTDDIKIVIINSLNADQSTDQLINSLKSVILNFKAKVQGDSSLTFDESRAILAFAEFESNSIADIVRMVNFLNTSSGGRTRGWFSNVVSVVVTSVVAGVVVAAVVATGGAAAIGLGVAVGSWLGTAVAVGAIVGGVYGGTVGYYMTVNQNSYFTDFDPENIEGGFLDWEHCTSNPGHWACI